MLANAQSLTIETPSRLHLGMFSFGEGHRRQYGGVGFMIREPRLRLVLRPARSFSAAGLHGNRVASIAQQVASHWLGGSLPPCALTVESAPRAHVGLGLGTQLSLAVGVGLMRFCGLRKPPTPTELAAELGRARRSSVGTHGFMRGGLIVEAGHHPGEPIGPILERVELPEVWRIVLLIPRAIDGMSGRRESQAFENLPSVPRKISERLTSEAMRTMLPAARNRDLNAFGESVYRFGHTAGACFTKVQGGPFCREAGPLVARLREMGVAGVGQSSWGPSVFAIAADDHAVQAICNHVAGDPRLANIDVIVSRPDNHGAVISQTAPALDSAAPD